MIKADFRRAVLNRVPTQSRFNDESPYVSRNCD